MDTTLKTGIWQQFGASIDYLADTIRACPAELWHASLWEHSEEIPEFAQFWYRAYHTLFWLDCYLYGTEEGFLPPHNADALRETMLATVGRIGLAHPGQRVVAVSHGGASNTFLAEVVGSPRRFFFNPGYASISRVQVWPADTEPGFRFVLMSINEPTAPRSTPPDVMPGG